MAKEIENSLSAVFCYQEYFNRKGRKWFTIDMQPSFFQWKNSLKCFFSKGTCMHLVPRIMALCPSDGALREAGSEYRQCVTRQRSQTSVLGSWVFLCSITFDFLLFLQWIMQLFDFRYYVRIQFLMPFCLSPFSLFTVKNLKCNQCWYSQWCHSHGPAAAGNFCKYLHWS